MLSDDVDNCRSGLQECDWEARSVVVIGASQQEKLVAAP